MIGRASRVGFQYGASAEWWDGGFWMCVYVSVYVCVCVMGRGAATMQGCQGLPIHRVAVPTDEEYLWPTRVVLFLAVNAGATRIHHTIIQALVWFHFGKKLGKKSHYASYFAHPLIQKLNVSFTKFLYGQ